MCCVHSFVTFNVTVHLVSVDEALVKQDGVKSWFADYHQMVCNRNFESRTVLACHTVPFWRTVLFIECRLI